MENGEQGPSQLQIYISSIKTIKEGGIIISFRLNISKQAAEEYMCLNVTKVYDLVQQAKAKVIWD